MFDDFANVWTMVGLGRELKRDLPISIMVAGERVVLFRDSAGAPVALRDRCPHRGVALSLGRIEEGLIECPFHGWRFNGRGENCAAPWNPDAKRERLGATALPAREAGGVLWLFTGFDPPDEPKPSATLSENIGLSSQSFLWQAHWTRVMENMLDQPHLPFVHRRTIGRRLGAVAEKRMDVIWEDREYGARISNSIDGVARPGVLDYRFPNAMELFLDGRGQIFRLMAVCVPEGEMTTRLTIYSMRGFFKSRLLDPIFDFANRRIAEEDRAIIESARPLCVGEADEELSVRTDAVTLAFRRIWRQKLLSSRASVPGRPSA